MDEKERSEGIPYLPEAGEEGVYVRSISPEELEEAIRKKDKDQLEQILEQVSEVDVGAALSELDPSLIIQLFRLLPNEVAAPLFDDLDPDAQESLLKAMTGKEISSLLEEQSADDVADAIDGVPANLVKKVLDSASPDMRRDVNRLLGYKEETAGAIMTTEYLEFRDQEKVKEAIRIIRERGKDAETVYTLFLRDGKRKFVGTVDLDDLIFADPEESLLSIMNGDAPCCTVDTDQEDVANLFRRYKLNAMAVVNGDGCLVGIVTGDDAVDVMTEETNEDIEHMNQVGHLEDSYLETHPFKMARKCVPWIIVLIILGTFSSMVLSSFQASIAVLPVLAAFVPVVTDTGGNAGGQTIALMIRGLALKEFRPRDYLKLLWQELRSALIIGLAVSLFGLVWFTLEQYLGIVALDAEESASVWNGLCWTWEFAENAFRVSGVLALTLFAVIVLSKLIAVTLTMLPAALKKDPAIVGQPLLTTIVDIIGLLVYFGVAEALILAFL